MRSLEKGEPQGPKGDGVQNVGDGGSLGKEGTACQAWQEGRQRVRLQGCLRTSQLEAGAGTGTRGSPVLLPPRCHCHIQTRDLVKAEKNGVVLPPPASSIMSNKPNSINSLKFRQVHLRFTLPLIRVCGFPGGLFILNFVQALKEPKSV